MLDSLKFVKGAVARKDPVPVLTHFSIQGGVIKGYNGIVCLAAPIPFAIDCQPKAIPFTKAIEICEGLESTPALSMTDSGRLKVVSGKFKVFIECSADDFPVMEPEGTRVELQPGLLKAFKVLAPLIAEDASRPWARGILLREGSAFATNNVCIGQYWTAIQLPFDMNVPDECVKEVIRVKQDPIAISATDRSITFHYEDGRWIKSQLLTTAWPNVSPVLDRPCQPAPIPQNFFDILGRLVHYADGARRVHVLGNILTTHLVDGIGASAETDGILAERGVYNIDLLRSLDGLVAEVDFTLYPAPALFFGPSTDAGYPVFRGAIVGMKNSV